MERRHQQKRLRRRCQCSKKKTRKVQWPTSEKSGIRSRVNNYVKC